MCHDLVDKDGTNVATVLKMIERINEYPEDMKGQKIAIIGGGAVGLDVMEFFTERGAEVTMVEMLPMIGRVGTEPVAFTMISGFKAFTISTVAAVFLKTNRL